MNKVSTSAWSSRNLACLSTGYRALVNLATCCLCSDVADTEQLLMVDSGASRVNRLVDIALNSDLYLLTPTAIVARISLFGVDSRSVREASASAERLRQQLWIFPN